MKIRFSKTLAAILAATTITAMSGVTALANIKSVATTTSYDWAVDSENPEVTITSTVNAANGDAGKQVTYLVADADKNIKFIDQQAIASKKATFTFKARNNDIFGGTVTAKFGTDTGADITLPTFTFTKEADLDEDGEMDTYDVDYFTTDAVGCSKIDVPEEIRDEFTEATEIVYGQLTSGDATEFGATVKIGETTYELPAYGTLSGYFCVVIEADADIADTDLGVYAR